MDYLRHQSDTYSGACRRILKFVFSGGRQRHGKNHQLLWCSMPEFAGFMIAA
jgi:hypothetical protein